MVHPALSDQSRLRDRVTDDDRFSLLKLNSDIVFGVYSAVYKQALLQPQSPSNIQTHENQQRSSLSSTACCHQQAHSSKLVSPCKETHCSSTLSRSSLTFSPANSSRASGHHHEEPIKEDGVWISTCPAPANHSTDCCLLVIRAHLVAAGRGQHLDGGLARSVGGASDLGLVVTLERQVSLVPACGEEGARLGQMIKCWCAQKCWPLCGAAAFVNCWRLRWTRPEEMQVQGRFDRTAIHICCTPTASNPP